MPNNKPNTVPNQRTVNIHKEKLKGSFLGINNDTWYAASQDLGAHALRFYLYLAANKDGYSFALSPAALENAIGIPRSTYYDQFRKLVNKGYLINSHGNTYEFYEKPQPRDGTQEEIVSSLSTDVQSPENYTADDSPTTADVEIIPTVIREINNNREFIYNSRINNIDSQKKEELYPEKIIRISPPIAEGKNRPKPIPKKKPFEDFIF